MARAMAAVTHANVVRLSDAVRWRSVFFLVMEDLAGGDLFVGRPFMFPDAKHVFCLA